VAHPDILKCPVCGGPGKLMYSKKGTFLGCCRYPQCMGIRRVSAEEEKEIAELLNGVPGLPRLPAKDENNGNGAH
jgi:ssDNA-binding Zn-finger/Zn-ribbon topoisomerase 1